MTYFHIYVNYNTVHVPLTESTGPQGDFVNGYFEDTYIAPICKIG
jgi:hypothetical protein